MFHPSLASWLALLSLLLSGAAVAQTHVHPHSDAPSHIHPHAHATAEPARSSLAYRSAFDGYRPFVDDKPTPWAAANAAAARSPGHSAHAAGAATGGLADPHVGHAMPMGKPPSRPMPMPHHHGAHP